MVDVFEIINIMTLFNEGKVIQYRLKGGDVWLQFTKETVTDSQEWNFEKYEYRVKPECIGPHWESYTKVTDFVNDKHKHGPMLKFRNYDTYLNIDIINNESIYFMCDYNILNIDIDIEESYHISELLNKFIWEDGTPCGIFVNDETQDSSDIKPELITGHEQDNISTVNHQRPRMPYPPAG